MELNEKKSNVLTKSDLGDIKTHLLQAEGYYKKDLYFWEQLAKREGIVSIHPGVVENIEVLRELEQNVEQLLTRIEEME